MTQSKPSQFKESLDLYQLQTLGEVVNIASIEVFIFRKSDLKFVYLNQGALQKMGCSLTEAKTMTPVDIKPDYNLNQFQKILEQVEQQGEKGLVFETVHKPKAGQAYDVEIKIQLLSWENEPAYVVFATDISERKLIQRQLAKSEHKFKLITESLPIGIFIYREKFQYANPAFIELTGYSQEELTQRNIWDLCPPENKEDFKETIKQRLAGKQFTKTYQDIKITTKSGETKVVRGKSETIEYQGQHAGLASIVDITDILKTQEQLKLFCHVVEQTDDLIRITNPKGLITYANNAFYRFTGYSEAEIIGQNNRILKSGKMSTEFYEKLWSTIAEGKSFQSTIVNRKKNGELFYDQQTITPLLDDNQQIEYYVSTSKDITDRVLLEQRNEQLAKTDKLTGASNRHRGDEFLSTSAEYAQATLSPLSVILIDIDFFKAVNDEFGHLVGDEVLVYISELINEELRHTDLFVRWGGEEFLIICTFTTLEQAQILAERIRVKIDSDTYKHLTHLTISCGVTNLKSTESTQQLIKRVDNALYKAKHQGRNRVITE